MRLGIGGYMELGNEYKNQQKKEYLSKLEPLFAYIPYFKNKEGAHVSSTYTGNDNELKSVPVPVYDSNVLAFVKAAQKTGLVTKNYVYAVNKIHAKTPNDERLFISGATFGDIDTIIAIMSKYVLGGMTKGYIWSEAVSEGVWFHCLMKLKELLEIYDKPLA